MTWRACSRSFQKPGSAMRASRALSVARLRSRSKIPPQLGEARLVLAQPASSIRLCHRRSTSGYATSRRATAANDGSGQRNIRALGGCYQRLEELLASGENLVERILKVRGRLGQLLPHLIDVLLVALLDLLTKELLESAVAESLFTLLRKVRNDVGHQGACEPLRLHVRIIR